MGHRAHPRRATQAGHRRQQSLDPTLSLARANALTEPDLAHVPAQPRPPSLAADLLTVPTLTFKTLYVLVLIAHDRRELAHANVTANPTAAWVWRQLIEDTPWGHKPRHLLPDRDAVYGHDSVSAPDASASTQLPRRFGHPCERSRGTRNRDTESAWTTLSCSTRALGVGSS